MTIKFSTEEFVLANQPQWERTGRILQEMRLALEISQKEIANRIGVSASVIGRLERGEPIQRRKLVETSYRTALEAIQLLKQKILDNLDVHVPSCLKRGRKCS